MKTKTILIITAMVLLAGTGRADDPEILGVLGMNPVEPTSCIAVYLPLEDGQALTGVEWYNNDGTVGFPEVLVSGGNPEDPGSAPDGVPVGTAVFGQSSGWSQLVWNQSYRSDAGGLYVVLRLPTASVYVGEGAGGGAAVGYQVSGEGCAGWLTADGEQWLGLQDAYGMAFRAVTVPEDLDTVTLPLGTKAFRPEGSGGEYGEAVMLTTGMDAPYPNPFNPVTKLRFTLAKAMPIRLEIYNLRGRLIRRLADRTYSAGEHVLTWYGRDEDGREAGSGVYLARLEAGTVIQTHRLMLVR